MAALPDVYSRKVQPWVLTLAYDGSSFHGWQVQPGLRTIQGTLRAALRDITGEDVLPQGSGRTDAGVHALSQTTTFSLTAPIPPSNLARALNRKLPPAIRVLSAAHTAPGFHARHSARQKTYEYRLHPAEQGLCSPFAAPWCWACPWPIAFESMQHAAGQIVGEHDFTSFAAADPDLSARLAVRPLSAVRTILDSRWVERDGLFVYRVTGSGFLQHMVRNLVGTFVEVGRGALSPGAIPTILGARDRSAAGPTAPAHGLFLVEVGYQ